MSTVDLCLTTFVGCLIGSFIPLVNTELVVLAAAAASPPTLLGPLALIAAVTQMGAKSVLYFAGSGMLNLPVNRWTRRLHQAANAGSRFRNGGSLVLFGSAFTGFPPFYLTSIASGAVRLPFTRFLAIGFAGRMLRFSALVGVPQAIRAVLQ
jgi:membrane protein YqaA with SNARE-associated domain